MSHPTSFKLSVKHLQLPPFLTNKIFFQIKNNRSLKLTSNGMSGKSRPTTTHSLKFRQEHPLNSKIIRKNKTNISPNFTEEKYNLLLNDINNSEKFYSNNTTQTSGFTNKMNKGKIKNKNKRSVSACFYNNPKTIKKRYNLKKYDNSISNNILLKYLSANENVNTNGTKNLSKKELNKNLFFNKNSNINYNKYTLHKKNLSFDNKYIYFNSDNIKERKRDIIVENNDELLKELYNQTINNFNNKYHLKYKTITEENKKRVKNVFRLLNQYKYQEERKNSLIKYLSKNSKCNKKNIKNEKEKKNFFIKRNKLLSMLFFRYNKFHNYKIETKNISIQALNFIKK